MWKQRKESYKEALKYIKNRKTGIVTSLRTPWTKVNKATLDGFEWPSTNIIGGRPGTGKTLWKDQLIREAFILNKYKFRVLEFSLEMVGRVSAIRDFSSYLKKPYSYLCSANGSITNNEIEECYNYAKIITKFPIDIVEKPITVQEFKFIVEEYFKTYNCKTVVTLDHSILLKKLKGQNVSDMLYELGEVLTELKRKYPVIFIILSQLNRNIDSPERNENGKYGNYILTSDIFGADALLQHADSVIGLNRPGKQRIKYFGPEKYVINDENILVMHFLKSRNGDTGMAFFKSEFDKMQINEIPTPMKKK